MGKSTDVKQDGNQSRLSENVNVTPVPNESGGLKTEHGEFVKLKEGSVGDGYYFYDDPDNDSYMYRPLTQRDLKDMSPMMQSKMQDLAFFLFDQNLMAHRIIEMTKDFVLGDGVTVHANNDSVQKVLDEFWQDPINNMELKQHIKVRELGIYGEQCYPVDVNESNGHVILKYTDPCKITKVIPNPENVEQLLYVKVSGKKEPYRIIDYDRNPESATYNLLTGDCIFCAINRVSNSTRGRSDLLTLADYIDGYDRFLFNRLERSRILNTFFWDVLLEGKSDEEIREWLKKTPLPSPGSMRAHNEKVKWEAVTVNLEAADASEEAKLFRSHISLGSAIPVHWMGGGEGITRATAIAMGTPAFKHFKTRQLEVKGMFNMILRFVIDQALIHGTLDNELKKTPEQLHFKIVFPKLEEKGLDIMASAIQSVMTSVSMAKDNGWVNDEEARFITRHVLALIGIELEKNPVSQLLESKEKKAKLKEMLSNDEFKKSFMDELRTLQEIAKANA